MMNKQPKPKCEGDCFNCKLPDCHPARGVLSKSAYFTGKKGRRPTRMVDGVIGEQQPKTGSRPLYKGGQLFAILKRKR